MTISPTDEPNSIKHYQELLKDQQWRLHNLYWIKDKEGDKVKFSPNRAQLRLMDNSHSRDIILKSRQHGFTTLIQILMLDECLFTPNTNAGVVAHNQKDAQTFFKDKIKFAYDHLPAHIREMIPATNDSAQELRFSNDSMIIVGTSLRSGTYRLMHISEFGKLCAKFPDRAEEVVSGALPTVPISGKIWIESTAEGRIGSFYEFCQTAEHAQQQGIELTPLDYKFHFVPWYEDDGNTLEGTVLGLHQWEEYFTTLETEIGFELTAGQRAWYVKTAQTQGDKMKREHPSTPREAFEASVEGAYFSRQMAQVRAKGQICRVPIEPNIPIHTFWDLGRDTTSIWFFQNIGFDYRFVDYYANDGEGMAFYLNILREKSNGGEPYLYGDMYLPHDGERKSMGAPGSPADVLYENNYSVRIVDRTPDKTISIERARQVIPMCYFDEDRCTEGVNGLDAYRKEWDEKHGVWMKTPHHGPESHPADAFMTFADGWHLPVEQEEDEHAGHHHARGRNATTGY